MLASRNSSCSCNRIGVQFIGEKPKTGMLSFRRYRLSVAPGKTFTSKFNFLWKNVVKYRLCVKISLSIDLQFIQSFFEWFPKWIIFVGFCRRNERFLVYKLEFHVIASFSTPFAQIIFDLSLIDIRR